MILLWLILLLVLLVCSIGPGLWLVRNLPWSAPERLCAAIGASGIVIYLVSGLIYILHLPRFSYFVASLVCLGFLIAARAHVRLLLANREVRWALGAFAVLFVWTLLFLAMVRNYSGAMWMGDWVEHYQRTQFFLEHQPADTLFTGVYSLPARPPLMNLIAGFYLAQAGERFDLFQVVFAVFNLLAFFPCWLIARHMVPRASGRVGRTVLLFLFAASPFIIENATYTATKGLTSAYVILGLCFYLRGWQRSDPLRLAAAGLALTAGILVHYSAVPYAILLLLHYGIFVFPRSEKRNIRVLLATALPSVALVGTWLAWSLAVYGAGVTFGSNTTAQAAGAMSTSENLQKIALNLFYTLVPHPLRLSYSDFAAAMIQPSSWGMFRDYYFTIAQTGLVGGMGCLGGIVVLFQLWHVARTPRSPEVRRRGFWLGLVLLGTAFTIATHPTVDAFGVAHVCSQPLLLLGLSFLAASFGAFSATLRIAVVLGCAADFLLGIFVHFSLQQWIPESTTVAGQGIFRLTTDLMGPTSMENLFAKTALGYEFLGDPVAGVFPFLQLLALVLFCAALAGLIRIGLPMRPAASPARGMRWGIAGGTLALGVVGIAWVRPQGRAIVSDPPGLEARMQSVQQDFDSSEARFNAGVALYSNGNVNGAVEQWAEALVIQPTHALARYFAEVIPRQHRLPAVSAVAVAQAVRVHPESSEAHFDLSLELWKRKHPVLAIGEMEEMVRLKPGLAGGQANLGQMNLEIGRLPASIAAFNAALRLQPDNAEIHYAIANALFRSDRSQEAVDHLRQALALKPDFPAAQAALQQITAPKQ